MGISISFSLKSAIFSLRKHYILVHLHYILCIITKQTVGKIIFSALISQI